MPINVTHLIALIQDGRSADYANDSTSLYDDWGNEVCEQKDGLAVPILIVLIAAIGLMANSVVIFIIVALKEYMKSVTNIYVLQLAIADFLFLFTLPFHSRTMIRGEWLYGNGMCKFTESIKMINYYASIMFLTIMSVDRYLAINFAMNQKALQLRTRKASVIMSTILWILSCLCIINIASYAKKSSCYCVINFPEDDDYEMMSGSGELDFELLKNFVEEQSPCSYKNYSSYFKNWLIANFVLAFIVPLLAISVCYALIIRRIIRPMAVGTKSNQSNKTRKRVTHMVTALVTVFVTCWLPYHAFNIARINDVYLSFEKCTAIQNFTLVLAYANSAMNPFFYTFLGTNFKRRWEMAMGKASRGLRQSILSHSGDYTPGNAAKRSTKRKDSSTAGMKNEDYSSSFATKHTVVPTNHLIQDDKV